MHVFASLRTRALHALHNVTLCPLPTWRERCPTSTKQVEGDSIMRALRWISLALAGAFLSGCAVYALPPGGYGGPYYAPPAYYGPSVGIGVYGGYGRGYYGHRHWR
jgi:hypothetical protein